MMKEVTPSTVPDSLLGEIQALVRLYRGEPVLEDYAPGSPETVVVLGTQVLPDGRPSRTLRARALHAARLYAGGEAALLIPTGSVGKHPPSEAEVADEVVLIEEEARSTRESARLVAAMAGERGIRGVVLVTDPLHCVRAIEAFRTEGLKTQASPVYSSPMWRSTRMRRGQFLREIGALLWYRLRRGSAKQRAGSR
jgi:uncharacterized SAM-binding protein YcdF (DUF218 family)